MKTTQRVAALLAGAAALCMGGGNEVFTGSTSLAAEAPEGNPCDHPQPIFGRIVAICGDQMILYTGDQRVGILGVQTTTSRFELAYCSTGGGRKTLHLQTNSEGYTLTSETFGRNEQYIIANMWGTFRMSGIGFHGEKVDVACVPFTDTRTNVTYMYR